MALIYQKDKNVQIVTGKHKGLTGIIISVILLFLNIIILLFQLSIFFFFKLT